ncbi:cytosolic sulfotransferase 17-like [Cornus florida]|uniref:cytosolic sulfotransferase 17-like n=1 Tax=Cornus florida TaxID=4283 RepID=UPI0028973316|nr:cytosolic sulfotransferase 17-like [Cornus florida]
MAASFPTQKSDSLKNHEETSYQKYLELVSTLPREKGWLTEHVQLYEGFWFGSKYLQGTIALQQHFKARANHVFLVTIPKSGTTWFKALLFAITNRKRYDFHNHPLLTTNPHEFVPYLEGYAIEHPTSNPDTPLLATHIPYTSLPKSILDQSGCPIVYVFRDPKDMFVSQWHFVSKLRPKELPVRSIEELFEQFCRGVSPYGPFWDHVLGYWRASVECPDKVLFLKYEDMKSEPFVVVKRLAEFLGHPFSLEEENEGVVGKIVELCSFENLSKLEVNKIGSHTDGTTFVVPNNIFFRQGKVGDSKNYLTSEMVMRIDQITKEKFKDLVI